VARDGAVPMAAQAVMTSFRPKRTGRSRSVVASPLDAKLIPAQQGMDSSAKTTLAAAKQDEAPAQTLLVVMRTEEFGPAGASWTVRVWRFTMLKAEEVPVGLKNPAKSL